MLVTTVLKTVEKSLLINVKELLSLPYIQIIIILIKTAIYFSLPSLGTVVKALLKS